MEEKKFGSYGLSKRFFLLSVVCSSRFSRPSRVSSRDLFIVSPSTYQLSTLGDCRLSGGLCYLSIVLVPSVLDASKVMRKLKEESFSAHHIHVVFFYFTTGCLESNWQKKKCYSYTTGCWWIPDFHYILTWERDFQGFSNLSHSSHSENPLISILFAFQNEGAHLNPNKWNDQP